MTERALLALAVGVLALQLAAARLPVWTPAGPARALAPEAAVFAAPPEGVALERSPGPGLRARLSCAPGARCRLDATWPAGWSAGAVRAEVVGQVAGAARLVLGGPGGRAPVGWGPGQARVATAVPGAPPPTEVRLALLGDGTSVVVRGLTVGPAARSPLRVAALAAWWVGVGGLALGGGRALAGAVDRGLGVAFAALSPLVVLGMVMPSAWLHELLLTLPGTRAEDLEKDLLTEPTLAVAAQKLGGHGLGFALLAALALRAGAGVRRTATWMVLLALLTESVQALLPDRSARVADVVVDLAGAVAGLAGWRLAGALRRRAPHGG